MHPISSCIAWIVRDAGPFQSDGERCRRHAAGIEAGVTVRIRIVRPIAHQPADFGKLTVRIGRGERVMRRQVCQLEPSADEKAVPADEKRERRY